MACEWRSGLKDRVRNLADGSEVPQATDDYEEVN